MTDIATDDVAHRIAPHDRRVRVFVSSTLSELAPEREAVRAAITRLRLTPVMFELGARPHPPRELYRSYLAQSDVFVGIYGESYGWVAPGSDVSGLEDEYLLSGDKPKLLYVKSPAPHRERRLTELIERIWTTSGASTTPYRDPRQLGRLVADDLAVLLTERFDAAAGPASQGLGPAPLPVPPMPIVGRDRETDTVLELLRDPAVRLVTLLGPGGIGKTRLALEVARRLAAPVTAFVDLAPLSDPGLVPGAIAEALGVRAEGSRSVTDVLVDRIGGRRVLLVLDNFEHVLEATSVVVRLLAACPGLHVLVTSRSVLQLRGEHEITLAPLAAEPAVEVFAQRARQVRDDFTLDEAARAAVLQIVDRLEGIPLAIELAAARVRILTPEALARRLDRRLDLRSQEVDRPSRQQTLRTTIGWSYALLGRQERALLRRLAVFVRGWSLEAAEAVGAVDGDLDVLDTLSALVGHSLVSPDNRSRGDPRFRMFETVREFALERLDASGERQATTRRLADYLCGLTSTVGQALSGPEGAGWFRRIDADIDTLRAVVGWAVDQDDAALAVRLTAPLTRYWWSRGRLQQMLAVAERTAALPSAAHLPDAEAAQLLWARGTIRVATGRSAEAVPMLERLVTMTRGSGEKRLLAQALFSLAIALPIEQAGPGADARTMLEEASGLFREVGDDWGVGLVLIPLGDLCLLAGDVGTARAMHQEVLARAEAIDDQQLRAQAHDQLALDALVALDPQTARRELETAAVLHRALGDYEGMAYSLDGFAGLALAGARPDLAARLLGAASRARELLGLAVWPFLRSLQAQLDGLARAALPAAEFDAAFAAGRELDPVAALDLAVSETPSAAG
ncbi:MAG TPA: DUF4062 domain-containing protein [Kineosporiaceae bacterium]|nr:DUF4062 domain-containing protein [Kineosporiaceae bacterium]